LRRRNGELGEKVREVVEGFNIGFCEGFRRGDAVAIAALYADDAVLLPPNRDMVHGRQEIEKFWAAVIQRGWKDMALATMELSENGDTAYAVGTYTVKISRKVQEPAEDKGKYLLVWKHTATGWKVHRDIWNSSTPRRK
jgi:uncharacterized protein (TIGR02246 family)